SENIFTLFELQKADINSLWDPIPFLKKVDYISDRVKLILENKDPLYTKDLAITGSDLIKELNLKPGKIIGDILSILLDHVLDDKNLNNKEILLDIAKKIN
ncbi:MAG: polynucleotide adenylyltransferase, partial [Clostridium sp.]|nr:polynucleotide adenylyltransferase [Clostridium sp.]